MSFTRARMDRTILVAGITTWTLLVLSIDNGHIGVFHDDGIYLVSAQSLRDGRGYQLPSRPGNPRPKYPPGFPLAIAATMRLFPGTPSLSRDLAAARAVVIASAWVFVLAAHRWLTRQKVPRHVATTIVLATAFHPSSLVGCASALFADLPFCALTYVVLLGCSGRSNRRISIITHPFATGLLAGAACLVRSNGITLAIAAVVGAPGGQSRLPRRATVAGGLGLVLFASRFLPTSPPGPVASGDYRLELQAGWSSLEAGLGIVGANLRAVLAEFPTSVLMPMTRYTSLFVQWLGDHRGARITLQALVSLIVFVGCLRLASKLRGRTRAAWFHAIGTVALFLIWPWTMIMDRFLMGLYPLVYLAFWSGLLFIGKTLNSSRSTRFRRFSLAALVLLGLGNAAVTIRSIHGYHAAGRQWPGAANRASLDQALGLIRDKTEPIAVIAARWPDTVSLYTRRQAVPLTEDDAILRDRFDENGRLLAWRSLVQDRPFYLLVRGQEEDPSRADLRQAESLVAGGGIRLEPGPRTHDDRYLLFRVHRTY